ncbi:MAG: hypothetical protein V4663_14895 [Bacteroidota bacterium]
MKVLITGGKSALALKMLKAFEQHQVLLADYGEMPNFSSSAYSFISLGEKNEDTIAHTLLNHCLNEGVDLILPLHTFEIISIAKAKILFNEFNIELLLPNADDLGAYFDEKPAAKLTHWVVFKNGEILFCSTADDKLLTIGKTAILSGAFYFDHGTVANLNLITI